jgi:hypothetical protein
MAAMQLPRANSSGPPDKLWAIFGPDVAKPAPVRAKRVKQSEMPKRRPTNHAKGDRKVVTDRLLTEQSEAAHGLQDRGQRDLVERFDPLETEPRPFRTHGLRFRHDGIEVR